MRRGESIGIPNAGSAAAAVPPALGVREGPSRRVPSAPLAPARVRLIQLQQNTPAAAACAATLSLHSAAVAHNLRCVLTSLDPEGPHQLRIALRRTRIALKVFEPVMRRKVNAELVASARALGGIAGELRDADVLIDEIIAPDAQDETALLAALNAWRQEVRGRVRARLLAADAPSTAAEFTRAAASSEWLKARACDEDLPFAALTAAAQRTFWERAAPLAARLADLSHLELHQLRKAVKAMRYGAELAASAGVSDQAAPRLKRIQDALGYANDAAALEHFNPPVFGETAAFQRLRDRLVASRRTAVSDAIAAAMREWRMLTPPACGPAN